MSAVSRRCRRWFGVGLTMALGQMARAYVPDGGPYWADGTVTLQLKLGTSPTYGDGTTPNGTATEALRAWNPYMKRVQLSGTIGATGEGGENNRANEVFFSKTIHGQAFGTNVLAVTMISTTSTQRWEADVVVNQKWTWDSYRGYLRPSTQAIDLRRVLEHEFGHVLGLSHPDEAGQYWGALMNSVVSDVDAPTPDDEEGVAFIYGHGVANPATLPVLYGDYPYDATVTEGGSAAFSVNVSGGSYPMTYQWFKDGAAIAGATSDSYSLPDAGLSDAGRYYVVVTNEAGAVTSREAVLTVNAANPPVIYNNVPRDETVVEGQSISFSVGISSGTYPFNYQWFKDDTAIAGATGSSYRLDVANLADAGSYYVVVSNRAGSATSRTTTLTVTPAVPPAFLGDARFIWVSMGHSVFLDAFPDRGSEPFSYQWKKDGVTIADAIDRNLYIPETSARDTGNYTLTVTNRAGSATSPIMTVTVTPLPRPPEAIIGIYYDSGDASSVRFSINDLDFSNAPYTFQWYKDGRPIPGAVNLVYILLKPSIADAGDYMVVVTNASGSTTSRVVTYTPRVAATAGGWLAAQAWIYVESPRSGVPSLPSNWQLHREGHAGEVRFALYRRALPLS